MKIACLVSGGVDSSVALKMAIDSGARVTAFYFKIWLEDELSFLGSCPWEEDLLYVKKTCEQLGVPLEVINLQKEYQKRIVTYTLKEVQSGRTPNPDVLCNTLIKFGAFFEWLKQSNRKFDKVVTGHYARVTENGKRKTENTKHKTRNIECEMLNSIFYLRTAPDPVKDQTYFLSRLTQEQLSMLWLPLGKYTKKEVREKAQQWNLPSRNRPDSQGLCFLGKISYADFVRHYLGEKEGDIVNEADAKVLGKHKGHWFYTIGQRHGLNLSGGPWYVSGKDVKKNSIFISNRLDMYRVEKEIFFVRNLHFLSGGVLSEKKEYFVKIRHASQKHRCTISFQEHDIVQVRLLDHKERGIAPGQFAVLYEGDVCVASGVLM
jgi:tRNA-specific 2-thiouridylase